MHGVASVPSPILATVVHHNGNDTPFAGGQGAISGIDFARASWCQRRATRLLASGVPWDEATARSRAEWQLGQWLAVVYGRVPGQRPRAGTLEQSVYPTEAVQNSGR